MEYLEDHPQLPGNKYLTSTILDEAARFFQPILPGGAAVDHRFPPHIRPQKRGHTQRTGLFAGGLYGPGNDLRSQYASLWSSGSVRPGRAGCGNCEPGLPEENRLGDGAG